MSAVIKSKYTNPADSMELSIKISQIQSINSFVRFSTEFDSLASIPSASIDLFITDFFNLTKSLLSLLLKPEPSAFFKNALGDSPVAFSRNVISLRRLISGIDKIKAVFKGYSQRKKYYEMVIQYKRKGNAEKRSKSNQAILQDLFRMVSLRKLNLEQCFRCADKDSDGQVTHNELKNLLESLQLAIPHSYITKFITILDEDCSGIITKEEYYKTLSAFQVQTESQSATGRVLQQEVLVRFSELLRKRNIDAEEMFNICDTDASDVISLLELEKYINIVGLGFQQKEITALMNILDSNGNGEVTREEFLAHVRTGDNGMFQVEKVKGNENMIGPAFSVSSKLEVSRFTLFDILDEFEVELPVEQFKGICNKFNPKITPGDFKTISELVAAPGTRVFSKTDIEEFCLFYTESNMLNKEQFVKKIEISLKKMNMNIENAIKAERIKGLIEPQHVANMLKRQFGFTEGQVKRFMSLFEIKNYMTPEAFQNLLLPSSPLQVFTRILQENNISLQDFFERADKKGTGKINGTEFEVTAIVELKSIDARLLTDLALMFPSPKIDKSTFLRLFYVETPTHKKISMPFVEPLPVKSTEASAPQVLKRTGTLYLIGSDKGAVILRQFVDQIDSRVPAHVYFEKLGYSLNQIFDPDKLFGVSSTFKVTRLESNELFTLLDKEKLGLIYAYSFVLMIDSVRSNLELLPTQENVYAKAEAKSVMLKLANAFTTSVPLYKRFPPLEKIVEWETSFNETLSQAEVIVLKANFPTPCYYYHIVATIQSYIKTEYMCGEQVIAAYIDKNKINLQAAEYFVEISCEKKYTKINLTTLMLKYMKKIEAESVYFHVYGTGELKPAYHFFTVFDCIQTYKRNKMLKVPELPIKNSSRSDKPAVDFFIKLLGLINKPLENYELSLTESNSEIGFGQILEKAFKIPRSETLPYLKMFKLSNDHIIRFYHIFYVLDSYRDNVTGPSSIKSYYSRMIHEYLPYGATVIYALGLFLKQQIPVASLATAFAFMPEADSKYLIDRINISKRGFIFGYEIASEIDQLEYEFPQFDASLDFLLTQASSAIQVSNLDFEEPLLKQVHSLESFLKASKPFLPPKDSEAIWNSLKFPGCNKLPFYFFLSFLVKKVSIPIAEVANDIRSIALNLPDSQISLDIFSEINASSTYEFLETQQILSKRAKIDVKLYEELFKNIDIKNIGKIFGFELLSWIDILRTCVRQQKITQKIILLPFSTNPTTAKSLQQFLKIIASELDFNNISTYSKYKFLEATRSITLNTLVSTFQELPESNLRELFVSLNVCSSGVQFYHVLAVIESYRTKFVIEKPDAPISLSARDPKVVLQQAKAKLKAYILGENPKRRQLDMKDIFGLMDKNGDGVITTEEFLSCLDMIRIDLTANEKIALTKEVDTNKDDRVNYEEIMRYLEDEKEVINIVGLENSLSSFKEGSEDQGIYKLKMYVKNNPSGPSSLENAFYRIDEAKAGSVSDIEFDVVIDKLRLNLNPSQKKRVKEICPVDSTRKFLYKGLTEKICLYKFNQPVAEKNPVISPKSQPEEPRISGKVETYTIVPDKDYFRKVNKKCTTILNSEEAALKRVFELYKNCPKFKDPDFGPEQGRNGDVCLYWTGSPPNTNYPSAAELEWKSPTEWLENVGFFKGGISSNDVIQGSLGDCWFIGALSVLAQRDELVRGSVDFLQSAAQINKENALGISKGVYPPLFHSFSKKGLYVFRFFSNNAWRWVIIDDRIPVFCEPDCLPRFVFAHCKDQSELWVSLIEKAYAKLYGCYESLNGGLIDDALVDLTGLVAEKNKIKAQTPTETENLWNLLLQYKSSKCLMGCSIDSEGIESDVIIDGGPCGLLARHAYALIDIIQIDDPNAPKKRHRLIRLRNPWGQREWNGKWADDSDEVNTHLTKLQQELTKLGSDEEWNPSDNNDGTFLMCFKDWRSIYHNLYACVDFTDEWWGVRFQGEWNTFNSGGVPMTANKQDAINWAKNPQFVLDIKTKTDVFVSLSQEDGRFTKNAVFPFEGVVRTACFTIMKLLQNEESVRFFDQSKIVKLSVLKLHRTVELRQTLEKGKYVIVPATIKPGEVGKFAVNVYFNCTKAAVESYSAAEKIPGMIIQEEEEMVQEDLTPRLYSAIVDLIKEISSLK